MFVVHPSGCHGAPDLLLSQSCGRLRLSFAHAPLARAVHLPYRMDMKREPGIAAPTTRRTRVRAHAASGFSLIELLVTALVIMILFTMYWGGNSGARQKSRQAACAQNLQKLHIALEIFGTDHTGNYPNQSGAKNSAE